MLSKFSNSKPSWTNFFILGFFIPNILFWDIPSNLLFQLFIDSCSLGLFFCDRTSLSDSVLSSNKVFFASNFSSLSLFFKKYAWVCLAAGSKAPAIVCVGDICIFDLEAPWRVNADKLKSKSKNTAIENRNLQGKILMTYLNGELVYSN